MKLRRLDVVCLVLLIALASACFRRAITVEELDHLIAKEVPARADKSQVLSFLDAHRIDHGKPEGFPSDFIARPERYFSNPKLDGKRERIRSYIGAKIPDVDSGFMTSFDIYVTFYFDEEDKLIEHLTEEIGTGP